MSNRDQQLYPNPDNVHKLVEYLLDTRVISRLPRKSFASTERQAKRLLKDLVGPWQTDKPDNQSCAEQLTQWAKSQLDRDGWRKVKLDFAKYQHNALHKPKRIDLKPVTLQRLIALKNELGFTSYDEVIDYYLPDESPLSNEVLQEPPQALSIDG